MSAQIYIKGKAGKDSNMVSTKTGKSFLTVSVASSYKKGNEWMTNWYDIMFFGDNAHTLQIKKGDTLIVYGEEQHMTYKNRSGNDVLKIQVLARDLRIIPKAETDSNVGHGYQGPARSYEMTEEDVPF